MRRVSFIFVLSHVTSASSSNGFSMVIDDETQAAAGLNRGNVYPPNDDEDRNFLSPDEEVCLDSWTPLPLDVSRESKPSSDLIPMLYERHVLDLTPEQDELLDPLERAVRYVVPIPKHYYWDVGLHEANWSTIPLTIKMWHNTIASCATVGTWTNDYIAMPIASYLGLTGPRFFEVLDDMTEEQMEESACNRERVDRDLRRRVSTP